MLSLKWNMLCSVEKIERSKVVCLLLLISVEIIQ